MVRLAVLRFLESYFRHRWLYLFPLVLLTAVGAFLVLTAPLAYTARSTMFVEDKSLLASLTDTTGDFTWRRTPAQSVVADFKELVQTDAFVRSAIQRTKLESEMSKGREQVQNVMLYFRQSVSVRIAGNKLVEFTAQSEDPQVAQQLVAAALDSYVFWKINADYQESAAAQAFFANLIQPYEEDLQQSRDDLAIYMANYPQPVRGDRPIEEQLEISRLQSEVDEKKRRLDDARSKEENARLVLSKSESVARQTYQVIDAPQVPLDSTTSFRQMAINIAIYLAVGLILSIVSVIGGALLDRSLRFPLDVRMGLGLPVLAMVDSISADSQAPTTSVIQPDSRSESAPPQPRTVPSLSANIDRDPA